MSFAKARIDPLDGWRGISISLVIIGHTWKADNIETATLASGVAVLGVYIFFFISGFIITKISLREYDATANFSIRKFYIRRIFRIIPPFFTFLFVVAVARGLSLIDQPLSGIVAAGAFLCNIDTNCGWFVGHTWSLAFEEQYYLLFPVLFALTGRNIGRVATVVLAIILALPFLRFFLNLGPWVRTLLEFTTPFLFICYGCVAAAYEARLERLSKSVWAGYVSCITAVVVIAILFANTAQIFPFGTVGSYLLVLLNRIVVPISLAWLVGSSVYQRNIFTTVLTAPPLLFVGTISYSLYLWQQMFLAGHELYLTIFLFWPLMFVLAWLSRRFIETPSIGLGRRLIVERKLAPLG